MSLFRKAGSADEGRTLALGRELLERTAGHEKGLLSGQFWSEKFLQWAMKDEALKVQLFRFVDVFPALQTPAEIHDTLADYLGQPGLTLPGGLSAGLAAGSVFQRAFSQQIAGQITGMAQKFIAGRDLADALPSLKQNWSRHVGFSVDLLGEACVSGDEAAAYQRRYLGLVEQLPGVIAGWPADPLLEADHLGPVPRGNVSVKISSLDARVDPIAFDRALDALTEALAPILKAAAAGGVLVNFDMEQRSLKDLTLALFERCCERFDFPAGLAMQAYLRSGPDDAARVIGWSKKINRKVTVRLVKGAYWDYHLAHAQAMGWPVPVWTDKAQTDATFERMAGMLIDACPRRPGQGGVCAAVGSHNARSIAAAVARVERSGLPRSAVEIQMLRGMADPLKAAAVDMGLRVREYVPVGELIPGMAYLVRRLLENTSNQSWLRAGFARQASAEELLAPPVTDEAGAGRWSYLQDPGHHRLSPAIPGLAGGTPFANEPLRDFADGGERAAFAKAVAAARVPGVPIDATAEQADSALAAAAGAFPAWRDMDAVARSGVLLAGAKIFRQRRDELSALVVRESGKAWREADADVCEAIDFIEFYARCAPPLFAEQRLGEFVAEHNAHWHQPRGVAAVISPWNFPLSICTGMTAAALATGNCAVVKPAEQTPAVAREMCRMLWAGGVPRGVLHFIPGRGETIGAQLVRDARVAIVAFTGSKEVGLGLNAAAAETPAGQGWIKRVICELGGKNAIIVDGSADLDQAVLAVRASAFGYAGQKCSACSRVVVVESVYDVFVRRLVAATGTLKLGDPTDPDTDVGPVIDAEAAKKIRQYIEIGKTEGRLALAMEPPEAAAREVLGKPMIGPHIFTDILPTHRLAREEIFGPVLSVMRARDFDEALAIANGVSYKLTGGVFSRRPANLEKARREFRVGNLYLNRQITGALVGRQPFGGLGLSGGGTKAGGAEYLLHFVDPRACTENTLRHGFAPLPEERERG